MSANPSGSSPAGSVKVSALGGVGCADAMTMSYGATAGSPVGVSGAKSSAVPLGSIVSAKTPSWAGPPRSAWLRANRTDGEAASNAPPKEGGLHATHCPASQRWARNASAPGRPTAARRYSAPNPQPVARLPSVSRSTKTMSLSCSAGRLARSTAKVRSPLSSFASSSCEMSGASTWLSPRASENAIEFAAWAVRASTAAIASNAATISASATNAVAPRPRRLAAHRFDPTGPECDPCLKVCLDGLPDGKSAVGGPGLRQREFPDAASVRRGVERLLVRRHGHAEDRHERQPSSGGHPVLSVLWKPQDVEIRRRVQRAG